LPLSLFDADEMVQYQEDVVWLERKSTHLWERLGTEPARIKQRYTLRSVRVFPLGGATFAAAKFGGPR
jgi:hypothetical protein